MMSRNGRRLLYTEEKVRAIFAKMRAELYARHLEQLSELADMRRELEEVRTAYNKLRDAVLARTKAEADLELLRRDRQRHTREVEGERFWLH
jgi:hypothetical protein